MLNCNFSRPIVCDFNTPSRAPRIKVRRSKNYEKTKKHFGIKSVSQFSRTWLNYDSTCLPLIVTVPPSPREKVWLKKWENWMRAAHTHKKFSNNHPLFVITEGFSSSPNYHCPMAPRLLPALKQQHVQNVKTKYCFDVWRCAKVLHIHVAFENGKRIFHRSETNSMMQQSCWQSFTYIHIAWRCSTKPVITACVVTNPAGGLGISSS